MALFQKVVEPSGHGIYMSTEEDQIWLQFRPELSGHPLSCKQVAFPLVDMNRAVSVAMNAAVLFFLIMRLVKTNGPSPELLLSGILFYH